MSTLDDNLRKRLAETMGSELDPELVTPMSAGPDEVPEWKDGLPVVKQFRDSNMDGNYSRNTKRRGRRGED